MRNSGDATRNAGLATEAFGRSLGAQLIPQLKEGRAALEATMANAEKFGFTVPKVVARVRGWLKTRKR